MVREYSPRLWAPAGLVAQIHHQTMPFSCTMCALRHDHLEVQCKATPCTAADHPQKVNVFYVRREEGAQKP